MIFNSLVFWAFFAAVLLPYFTLLQKKAKYQNAWLLVSSYFFYGWASWRMVPLLFIVSIIYYGLGIAIARNNESRTKLSRILTTSGVILGIGVLFYFKYLGFFINEFSALFNSWGFHIGSSFSIIMPIGISFFTFKLISYVIEIHRQTIQPTRDFIQFSTYISFFPTIMSGPIDRPEGFLPQLRIARRARYIDFSEGTKRILWGLFLKMCIADVWSPYTDAVFLNCDHHNTTSLLFASPIYLIQMYADFCGYSEMAIGVAQIMGLHVVENFNRPFFAQNVAEYWRRWHMSLTTWITDYVFMPLNVKWRDWGKWGLYLATVVNLVVIGVWHGANWTYALFGLYHGILLVITIAMDRRRKKIEKRFLLKNKEWYKWSRRFLTFWLFTFGAVLFRSIDLNHFVQIMQSFGNGFGRLYNGRGLPDIAVGLLGIGIMLFREYCHEYKKNVYLLHSNNRVVMLGTVVVLVVYIFLMANFNSAQFIYFQF